MKSISRSEVESIKSKSTKESKSNSSTNENDNENENKMMNLYQSILTMIKALLTTLKFTKVKLITVADVIEGVSPIT